jgi:NAD(P)-dependent dehydrogenase (short-subunit alcohol dehydrogenase family)
MRSIASLSDLRGQVALITGGAGHVGRVVASGLAELGCTLYLLDGPGPTLDGGAKEILERHNGANVFALECDLEDEHERRRVLDVIQSETGRLDALVHCAAFVGDTKLDGWVVPFEEQGLEAVRRCLEVNLTSAFHLSQLLTPLLSARSNGRVLNVGSIYGVVGPDMTLYDGTTMGNPAAYAMSKGGLMQLTRWMAAILAPDVRVNAISLGGVFRNQPAAFVDRYVARTPMRRMATEEDFVGAVAYFCSDLSAYVTGQNLMIDGGWTAW